MPIDGSNTRVVKMPQLTPDSAAVDVWFELGKIRFNDPNNPDEVCSVTIEEFEERIRALESLVNSLEERASGQGMTAVSCGKKAFDKFLYEAHELIRECKRHIHIGMPLNQIISAEIDRKPVSRRVGGGMVQRDSGLVVPN